MEVLSNVCERFVRLRIVVEDARRLEAELISDCFVAQCAVWHAEGTRSFLPRSMLISTVVEQSKQTHMDHTDSLATASESHDNEDVRITLFKQNHQAVVPVVIR